MTAFEDGLWDRLVDEHGANDLELTADHPSSARRPLMIGGGLTAVAAATAAGVIALTAATDAPPAYAMTQNPDGTLTVTIHDMRAAIPELNARFAQMGIDETVVPVEASCPAGPNNTGIAGLQADDELTDTMTLTFDGGNGHLQPGYHGVLAAEQLPNGEIATVVGARPTVPDCFPTTAYKLVPFGTTSSGEPRFRSVAVDPNAPFTPTPTSTSSSGTTPAAAGVTTAG
jgi:hypothetical protein